MLNSFQSTIGYSFPTKWNPKFIIEYLEGRFIEKSFKLKVWFLGKTDGWFEYEILCFG